MNLTALLAQCRVFLQDPSPGVRWSDAELTQWLNEAQDDFALKTRATQTDATLSVNAKTPANAFYTLPADLLSLTEVRANGLELCPVSLPDVSCITNWETDTGAPYRYLYGPYGQNILRIYPYQAGVTVKVFYVQQPAPLALGSDTPPFLAAYHIRLAHFAVARAYLKNGDYQNVPEGQTFNSLYEEGVSLALANMPAQPTHVPFRNL